MILPSPKSPKSSVFSRLVAPKLIRSKFFPVAIALSIASFPQVASAATLTYAYVDNIVTGWQNWSWGTTYTNDTAVKKSGTASAKVTITTAWAGFSLSQSPTTTNLNTLSAISFDINPGAATNVAKVAAIKFSLQNGNTLGNPVNIASYASPALTANTWSTVTIPISLLAGTLTALNRLNFQDGLGQGNVVFNVDNVGLVAVASACSSLVVDSGTANGGVTINNFLNDQYKWYDSNCRLRTAALARNDTSKGGNAKQFTYVLANGTTRLVNPGASAGGFGYIVAHLSNPSFARAYGASDSPFGSGNSATTNKLFVGTNHAIHEYTLNYVRYGLTQAAINSGFAPWTQINSTNKSNVRAYNMPVRIQWLFATGRNYPIWSVTFDLSAAPNRAVDSDFRAPYGDMKIEGGDGSALVGGVGWGDKYKFLSAGSPFTMNNDWDYSQLNPGAPYSYLWTTTGDAEMGLAGTQLTARQNAGGYNNYQAPIWRGKTSLNMGTLCLNDGGAGVPYNHKTPCTSHWAYQLIQYSLANATQTTSNKRLAWGADWGSLGNSSFTSSNGYTVSGYPKVSYSVHIVLDPHTGNPTQAIALQAKTASVTTLTASVGTVRTSGIAGVGRTDTVTYSPPGFSPIFGTWEVNAAANDNLKLSFDVPSTAPSTLDSPIIVVNNYTRTTAPTQVLLEDTVLVANRDYFVSLRPNQSQLWITLNKKLAGKNSFSIVN
jgi:hypothetical protein